MNRLWMAVWLSGAVLCAANAFSGVSLIKPTDLASRAGENDPRARAVKTTGESPTFTGSLASARPQKAKASSPSASERKPVETAATVATAKASAAAAEPKQSGKLSGNTAKTSKENKKRIARRRHHGPRFFAMGPSPIPRYFGRIYMVPPYAMRRYPIW